VGGWGSGERIRSRGVYFVDESEKTVEARRSLWRGKDAADIQWMGRDRSARDRNCG
jgi:hypothetical protein